jgi:3'-5' exonuclease
MRLLSLDCETFLISRGNLAPKLVCAQFFDGEQAYLYKHTDHDAIVDLLLEGDPLVGHNVAFDLAVLMNWEPELVPVLFDKLDHGEILDTMLGQQLIDIATGEYAVKRHKPGYSLAAVAERYGFAKDAQDPWRMRYSELYDIPVESWPEDARRYAQHDAEVTYAVYQKELDRKEILGDLAAQTRAALALHLCSVWGVHTAPEAVERLKVSLEARLVAVRADLQDAGIVRANGTRSIKSAQKMAWQAYVDLGIEPQWTKKGKEEREAKEHVVGPDVIDDDANKEHVRFDWRNDMSPEHVSLDEDSCNITGLDILIKYAEYTSANGLRTRVNDLAQGYELPLQCRYTSLIETGRTSCSKPKGGATVGVQLQNMPRLPGFRECFVPRQGMAFVGADISGAELRTFSQVCIDLFGFSKLGEALNAGVDAHIRLGATILGITYEEALAKKKTPEIKHARQQAKICFHPDVEALTPNGWVKVSELQVGVPVAAASFDIGGITKLKWEVPTQLTNREAPELVHLYNEGIDLFVTPDHRMAYWRNRVEDPLPAKRDPITGRLVQQIEKSKSTRLEPGICFPEQLNTKRAFPNAGLLAFGVDLPENLLRVAVATQADGSYTPSGAIRFGFTKKRKIERFRMLFSAFEYKETINKQGVTCFKVPPSATVEIRAVLDPDKTLPWYWLKLSFACRQIVLDEVKYWDSHITPDGASHYQYGTTIRKNADILQALASITGFKASIHIDYLSKQNPLHADFYVVYVKNRANTRGGNVKTKRISWNKPVYCLTLPSDAVLVRQNGKTVVTRQCNFGLAGGMGPDKFVEYARTSYGVTFTRTEAVALREKWFEMTPEARLYFKHVGKLINKDTGKGVMKQLRVERWRGDVRFTDAANGFFQSLCADGTKAGLYAVTKACYAEPESPLYGCRPWAFIHDEIIIEAPIGRVHESAMELQRIMEREFNRFVPDCPTRADPWASSLWSKQAEAVWLDGKLQIWSPENA